jgi:spore germination cell wall hydrolase CwlJ-like protein
MKFYIMAAVMLIVANVAQAQTTNLYTEEDYPQAYCMALNIYYEARGSNLADRAATADVVINRVLDTRYPNTICEVVKQGRQHPSGAMMRNKCQFSWYCDGKHDRPQNEDLWIDAQMLAYQMVHEDKYRGITEGATHYHATYVKPHWASTLQLVGRIGAHIFYRWK